MLMCSAITIVPQPRRVTILANQFGTSMRLGRALGVHRNTLLLERYKKDVSELGVSGDRAIFTRNNVSLRAHAHHAYTPVEPVETSPKVREWTVKALIFCQAGTRSAQTIA